MTAVVPSGPAGERPTGGRLIDQFEYGLDAPICLTWELTYACNLACAHCLSSSGRRDPRELSTAEAEAVIDELQRMQVFYVKDRKSTRLNSSHANISYAVFCLNKKTRRISP